MDDALPGLDVGSIGAWLGDRVDATPPFAFELIAAGGSNLTFRVTDAAGSAWALRRPPTGQALATAHDVDREWRILSALHDASAAVKVPRPVVRCDDLEVTGAPFFVMEFVDGMILRTEADAAALDEADVSAAAQSLVATQVALHDLDVNEIGLGDLGRRSGYVARQLRRWKQQVERAALRDLPLLDDLHERLSASIPPESPRPSLVHGDYRFDNVVLGADRTVAAVLDWELCTVGDPIADACWSLLYWADPDDDAHFLPSSPTLTASVPDRAWATERYEQLSGRSLESFGWFAAFGWWKMACIVEGVHGRRRRGARGGMDPGNVQSIADSVERMLRTADDEAREQGV